MKRTSLKRMLLAVGCIASSFAAEPSAQHRMQFPGKTWAISVTLPGFEVEEHWTRKDETGMMMRASNKETGMIASIYLERERKPRTSSQCRTKYFNKALSSELWKSRVRRWETEPLAFGQYMIDSAGGVQINQMHVNAYLGQEDICMDLHLSKPRFSEPDRELFDTIVSSLKVIDAE